MSAELGFSASLLMSDECHVLVVTQGWLPFHSFVSSCFQENEMDLGLYGCDDGFSSLLRERRSDVRG